MVDLVARQGRFKGISRDETNDLIRRAVPIIRQRILCGVAVSCWVQDVYSHSPRWIRGFGHPYAVCCHLAMAAMGIWARDHHEITGITYAFESGDAYSDEAHSVMSGSANHPIAKYQYQYKSHAFFGKDEPEAVPIEAADFLAWEWGKFFEESFVTRKRPMRLSLVHLLNGQLERYMLRPMYGERFARYLNDIRGLGLEELQEREALSKAPPIADLSTDTMNAAEDDRE
jgi:hypothetical protein